jgi:hypothetical protein
MDALRKIGSVIVLVLTVIGFLAALGGCVGVWSYKDDVTAAVTSGLDTAIKVATLGERATAQSAVAVGQVGAGLSAAQESLGERVANRQENIANLKADAIERYGPTVNRAVETVSATTDAIVSFNATLEAVNRIPGVTVPTFTAELETAQSQLEDPADGRRRVAGWHAYPGRGRKRGVGSRFRGVGAAGLLDAPWFGQRPGDGAAILRAGRD